MPTYTFNPINSTPNNNTDNTRAKDRIFQFSKTSIEMDELSMPAQKTDERRTEDVISLMSPIIRINEYIVTYKELLSVSIDCTDFIPRISMKAIFFGDEFLGKNPIKDGDILSIAIRPKSESLKMVRNDYIITNCFVEPHIPSSDGEAGLRPVTVSIYGELFIPNMYNTRMSLSNVGTSFETLRNIADKLLLGFASNEEATEDKQIWLDYGITPYAFIHYIAETMWKDSNSFFNIWIDVYYNLNVVNVNKQLISPEDDIDIAAELSTIDINYTYTQETSKKTTTLMPKTFSNMPQMKGTAFYINSWSSDNNSSNITSMVGVSMYCNFLEQNQNVDREAKDWSLKIDPMYDRSKTDTHIILRGRTSYNPNSGEMARSDYKASDMYIKSPWMGVQHTCTNTDEDVSKWDGNHHKNYYRAKVHNTMNLYELEKLNVSINTTGANMNVIKGDKIPVILMAKSTEDQETINPGAKSKQPMDYFHSGWYYVKGFTLSWIKSDNSMCGFENKFVLSRREWATPEPISKK